MSALPKRQFTQEDYSELELKSDYKSQYVAGEIFAMAGAQPEHVALAANIDGMLYVRFRGRSC